MARTALTGAAVGVVTFLARAVVPAPLAAAVGLAALGVAAVPPKSWRSLAVAAAIAAAAVGVSFIPGAAAIPMALAVASLMFSRDKKGPASWALAAGAAGLAMGLGYFVGSVFNRELLDGASAGIQSLAAWTTFGFFGGLGTVGRQLELMPRGSQPALEGKKAEVAGELGQLLGRASQAFAEAAAALGPETTEAGEAAADLMGKIERFAGRWSDLERELIRTDRPALAGRLAELQAREEASQDEVVREEYASARGALVKQEEYLAGIARGRDRAVARLHHHVAVLERLRLAALHHRAVDAGRVGEELAPLVGDLVAAGRELDNAAEAIAELPALSSIN